MISRTTVKLKKLKGKKIIIEILTGDSTMGRKRKPGRPKGSKTKKRKKAVKSKRKGLPPRIKTGKRKGQFRKRKGKKKKKKKKGNPNNCRWG